MTSDTLIKLVTASVGALLAGGTLSGWSVAITKTGEVETVREQRTADQERQRESLTWARDNGLLFTLAELPEECAERFLVDP